MPGSRPQALVCKGTEFQGASSAATSHNVASRDRSLETLSAVDGPYAGAESQPAACLVSVIEADIIPRLLLMHRTCQDMDSGERSRAPATTPRAGAKVDRPAPDKISAKEVADLLELVRHDAIDAGLRYVQALRRKGHPVERIFASLLAPVARQLGEMWVADEVSFLEVTLATARIQRILFELCQPAETAVPGAPAVLLTVAPGEQHTLGMHMAAAAFQQAGIQVVSLVPTVIGEIEAAVRADRFDLVGFSLGSESLVDKLADAIEATRVAAQQSTVKIVVGGAVSNLVSNFQNRLGADHVVRDVSEAIAIALESASHEAVG